MRPRTSASGRSESRRTRLSRRGCGASRYTRARTRRLVFVAPLRGALAIRKPLVMDARRDVSPPPAARCVTDARASNAARTSGDSRPRSPTAIPCSRAHARIKAVDALLVISPVCGIDDGHDQKLSLLEVRRDPPLRHGAGGIPARELQVVDSEASELVLDSCRWVETNDPDRPRPPAPGLAWRAP